MKKNMLGNTGIEISELSFGTLTLGKIQADLTVKEGGQTVKKAFEVGINFFDTAPSYGTEAHLREGLRRRGDKAIISTRTRARTRDIAQRDFEASLKELNREYIDIYHLHQVHGAQDLADRRPVIDFLLELKEQGLVRAIGASVHKVEAARAVVAESDIDVLGPMLNSHGLGIIDGSIDDMVEVCSQVDTRGMGIYARCGGCEACVETCAQEALSFDRSQTDESKGKRASPLLTWTNASSADTAQRCVLNS